MVKVEKRIIKIENGSELKSEEREIVWFSAKQIVMANGGSQIVDPIFFN